jgi:hypothetical protein
MKRKLESSPRISNDACSTAPTSMRGYEQNTPSTANALEVPELDRWVSGERLREIIWDDMSRPSMQWVRKETKRRMLPHIRRGHLIFYRPRSVLEWFNQRESRPASMKYVCNIEVARKNTETKRFPQYPDAYSLMPPGGTACAITGLDCAHLSALLASDARWRTGVRVVEIDAPGHSERKILFHVGDVLRLLDQMAKEQTSVGRAPGITAKLEASCLKRS